MVLVSIESNFCNLIICRYHLSSGASRQGLATEIIIVFVSVECVDNGRKKKKKKKKKLNKAPVVMTIDDTVGDFCCLID